MLWFLDSLITPEFPNPWNISILEWGYKNVEPTSTNISVLVMYSLINMSTFSGFLSPKHRGHYWAHVWMLFRLSRIILPTAFEVEHNYSQRITRLFQTLFWNDYETIPAFALSGNFRTNTFGFLTKTAWKANASRPWRCGAAGGESEVLKWYNPIMRLLTKASPANERRGSQKGYYLPF